METIKIAHLYYDLMNLYGENGNLKVLTKHLENQNIKVITHYFSLEDDIDFAKYDIFYIGCGSTENFKLVLENILKYKKEIKKALEHKFFIVTGNALNLFGKTYYDLNNNLLPTLDLLNFESKEIKERIVGEQEYHFSKIKEHVIGFQNRDTIIYNINELHLFEVINGMGSINDYAFEGIQKNNFYGTYLLGPILARNPYFTEYLVKKILQNKELPYQEKTPNEYEIKAYEVYLKNVINQKNKKL